MKLLALVMTSVLALGQGHGLKATSQETYFPASSENCCCGNTQSLEADQNTCCLNKNFEQPNNKSCNFDNKCCDACLCSNISLGGSPNAALFVKNMISPGASRIALFTLPDNNSLRSFTTPPDSPPPKLA